MQGSAHHRRGIGAGVRRRDRRGGGDDEGNDRGAEGGDRGQDEGAAPASRRPVIIIGGASVQASRVHSGGHRQEMEGT